MADKNQIQEISLSQHIVYCCSRFLAYGLPLIFFLVTTSFYLKTYDSAQVKITITQISGTILLLVWLIKILVEGRFPFTKSDLVYVAPFLAFLVSGLLAYANSPFKGWALEETIRRIFYMVFALIAIAEMRSEERMRRLWRWLIAAAWVAIGYGVIQFIDSRFFPVSQPGTFMLDPFIWRQAFQTRVFSTFGNPNFYGNFLVITTPLILSSILRGKGSLVRPFVALVITLGLLFLIDKMTLGLFGGYDPAYQVVFGAGIFTLLILFLINVTWKMGTSVSLPWFLVLFAMLFLNLYATETKGAWVGFTAAVASTVWLIFEFFLHMEDRDVNPKKYFVFLLTLISLFTAIVVLMVISFVLPLFKKDAALQTGFSILWIPTVLAALVSLVVSVWLLRKPWNLKKVVYGVLVFFVLGMSGFVLEYAKGRLLSVSFRLFTWDSTWEMVRTQPIFGNGVGTFKVIYPAFRRKEIIVLEGKSNTETDHSEDEYIETWQDEGIVGFGLFLWMIITALTCGLRQLRWYSKIRAPDRGSKRKLLEIESDPRSYEVLGLLGAYMGALIHWCVDVSVRFVSSGIFSGLLPGLLVAYARNQTSSIKNEVRLPYERWIRAAIALVSLFVMLYLGMELVPQSFTPGGYTPYSTAVLCAVATAGFIWILMEALEWGNKPQKVIPFAEQYEPVSRKWFGLRVGAIVLLMVGAGALVQDFGDLFQADVHHNLAIFFSKQSLWRKEPKFDAQVNSLPPDIREKYKKWGGALEHYAEVNRLNPYFPMARYFTGNVYNDWGTQSLIDSENARAKGDLVEAERLKQKALDMWDLSEKAYNVTKQLAPNYVQTHHQMGILFVKRAEAAARWGDVKKSQEYYAEALKDFERYHMIDPVFPQNYDRMVQILVMQHRFKEAEDLYTEAIYNNDEVSRAIRKSPFYDRVAELSVSLAKLYYTEALQKTPNPFSPLLPQISEALKYFQKALEMDPKSMEALKGLGFMYSKLGKTKEAQEMWGRALRVSPNDPDIRVNLPKK